MREDVLDAMKMIVPVIVIFPIAIFIPVLPFNGEAARIPVLVMNVRGGVVVGWGPLLLLLLALELLLLLPLLALELLLPLLALELLLPLPLPLPLLAGDVVVLRVIISGVKIGNRQIAAIVLMAQVHVLLLVKGVVAVL